MAVIKTLEQKFLIDNVYGPNEEDPQFYLQLEECVKQVK